jgi:uncharacterized protein
MKTKDFALSVKDVSDEGTFEGHVSVAGNVDSYGEIVMPTAFAKSLARHAKAKTSPLMLWQHNPDHPIGIWESLEEDSKGLWGRGRLVKGVRLADEAHLLLKAGAIQGLSIGYREVKTVPNGTIRELHELDLIEASIVSMPANPKARVVAVKSDHFSALRDKLSAGELPTEREFEKGMRDAFDLSNSEAERVVRLIFKQAQGEPESSTADHAAARIIAIAKSAAAGISILK